MDTWDDAFRRVLAAYLRAVVLSEPLQRELARRHGVSLSDLFAVRALRSVGECPVSRFGQALGLPRSTTTDLVDRLEAAGLVTRHADETDRRVTNIRLTARASEALGDTELFRESEIARRLRRLDEHRRGVLAEMLETLVEPENAMDTDRGVQARQLIGTT